jgi:hypothetical protein
MTPAFRRSIVSLFAALAVAGLLTACGEGAVTKPAANAAVKLLAGEADDAARVAFSNDAARVFPRLAPKLRQPAPRGATTAAAPANAAVAKVQQAMSFAFCEAWAIYEDYGQLPTRDEWLDIAAYRLQAAAYRYPPVLSQVISTFNTIAYAVETGNVAVAEVDLYCQFG